MLILETFRLSLSLIDAALYCLVLNKWLNPCSLTAAYLKIYCIRIQVLYFCFVQNTRCLQQLKGFNLCQSINRLAILLELIMVAVVFLLTYLLLKYAYFFIFSVMFLEIYTSLEVSMRYYGSGKRSLKIPFNFLLITNGGRFMRPQSVKDIINSWMSSKPTDAVPNWAVS